MAYVDENLNDPTKYFEALIWTGDGTSPRTLSGLEFQPDMIWSKRRDDAAGHNLLDSTRGAGENAELCPSSTGIAGSNAAETYGYLSAFTSDGFTVTEGSSDNAYWNNNTATYVAWCWKAGTTFTNDASATSVGNTDSNGTASSTAGFSIAKWVGAGASLDIQVKHGLSAAPAVMITKNNEEAGGNHWAVYHHANTSNPETDYLKLSATTATTDEATIWADTAPTSTVFTAGDHSGSNRSGDDFVGYFWNEVQGFSKFGSFSGTGSSATYAFVYLGFRPAWVMIKKTNSSGSVDWYMFDNKRSPMNAVDDFLKANTTGAEGGDGNGYIDFLSNGFKLKTADIGTESGGTFVYMAFAEAPFVNSNGVPVNAR
tara:strand:+ start:1632 stop:2744 length:1113 start_codon:yes stop_codon:yes gene_type:complete